jgi:RNA polymerase primary sigma factor
MSKHEQYHYSDKTSWGSDPFLNLYMQQLPRTPLLSREEEKQSMIAISRASQTFRENLLSNDYFTKSCIRILSRVVDKRLRPRSTFMWNGKNEAVLAQTAVTNLPVLRTLMQLNRRDLKRMLSKASFEDERCNRPELTRRAFIGELKQRLLKRRLHAYRLLEETPIREKLLVPLLARYEKLTQALVEARKELIVAKRSSDKELIRSSSAVYCGLIYQCGDVPASATRTCEVLKKSYADLGAARHHMFLANARLVFPVVKEFAGVGLDVLELVQAGNVGLMNSIHSFDWERGYKFSTYATHSIQREVFKVLKGHGSIVSRSKYAHELSSKLERVSAELGHKFGRRPRIPEVLEELNRRLRDTEGRKIPLTELDIEVVQKREIGGVDLASAKFLGQLGTTQGIGEGASTELHDMLEAFPAAMATLHPWARVIIENMYGLGGREEMSRRAVARLLDLSESKVKTIEKNALRQLKTELRLACPQPMTSATLRRESRFES